MNLETAMREEARLIILRDLAEQPNGALNSSLLRDDLELRWGITKTRAWVHEEIRYLADMGAVVTNDIGSVIIATITVKGQDHVQRRIVITGVKRPSPPEG